MALIIDGYNLLYAANIVGRGVGPSTLERSRQALLRFVAASVEPEGLARTIIVFDAADAPPGLPDAYDHEGMSVRFARGYENADAMIEELILQDSAPRSLTVVSSDHRIQRAARRRRAEAIDSDVWYKSMIVRRRTRPISTESAKPTGPPSDAEVEYWLKQFGGDESEPPDPNNPFPPGYGEDVERE